MHTAFFRWLDVFCWFKKQRYGLLSESSKISKLVLVFLSRARSLCLCSIFFSGSCLSFQNGSFSAPRITYSKIARFLDHGQIGVITSSFYNWQLSCKIIFQNKVKICRSVDRLKRKTKKLWLLCWCRSASSEKKNRHNRAAMRAQVQKVLLCPALKKWKMTTDMKLKRQYLERVAAKAVHRLQHLGLRSAVMMWAANTSWVWRQRRVLGKAVTRMRGILAVRCFGAWHDNARSQRHGREVLGRVVERFRFYRLCLVFAHWISCTCLHKQLTHCLTTVILHIHKVALHKALASRQGQVTENLRFARVTSMVVHRLQHACRRWVMKIWAANACSVGRQLRLLDKAVTRMRGLLAVRCFGAWHDNATSQRRSREVMGRVVARLRERCVHMAFCSWTEQSCLIRRHRLGIAAVMRRMQHKTFATWLDFSAHRKHAIRVASKVGHHLQYSCLIHIFQAWMSYFWSDALIENIAYKSLTKKSTLVQVSKFFQLWGENVKSRIRIKHTVIKVMLQCQIRSRVSIFLAWSTLCTRKQSEKAVFSCCLRRFRLKQAKQNLIRWIGALKYSLHLINAEKSMKSRMRNKTYFWIFQSWWVNLCGPEVKKVGDSVMQKKITLAANQDHQQAEIFQEEINPLVVSGFDYEGLVAQAEAQVQKHKKLFLANLFGEWHKIASSSKAKASAGSLLFTSC